MKSLQSPDNSLEKSYSLPLIATTSLFQWNTHIGEIGSSVGGVFVVLSVIQFGFSLEWGCNMGDL